MEFVDQDVVDQFAADLGRAVSMTRLEAHRPMGGSNWGMIVNYYWNVDLCEALHPSIHDWRSRFATAFTPQPL